MENIKQIISEMTLEEKIGQLTQVSLPKDYTKLKDKIRKGEVGSIILSATPFAGNDPKAIFSYEVINELQKCAVEESRMKIPFIVGQDAIHGYDVIHPLPLAMAASFNPELIEKCYSCTADEVKNGGIRWAFSPMLDVSRDPRWGRCVEGPGEDPYLGCEVAKAVIRGFQNRGIAACAKHYIGYGESEGGRDYAKTEISDYSLHNYYLKAFKAASEENVATVMNSFNEISGQPTASSRYLLTDVLRGELGFLGFVVSDWGSIEQLINQGVAETRADCARLALNAGIDMDMCCGCYEENLKKLVESGIMDESVIDTAVYRILKIKESYNLFLNPYTYPTNYDLKEHLDTSYKMAAESMVLLKNKDGVLPLKKDINVMLVGPMVNNRRDLLGSWTPTYNLNYVKTYAEEIARLYPEVNVLFIDGEMNSEMLVGIEKVDVVIACLGESCTANGELNSLANIELPSGQKDIVKRAYAFGKPIIGLMNFGRPIALGDMEPYFGAILYTWQCGTMSAKAALEIVFGKVNPSGKLPMTMVRNGGQIPLYYNFPPSGRAVNGYYELGEGMRNYNDCPGSPLYPFGYGLSYTKFEYSNIKIKSDSMTLKALEQGNKFEISVSVKNTGNVKGAETVQLYVRDKVSSLTRPIRELKAFKKIYLNEGESEIVKFELGYGELSFYNETRRYVVEEGNFDIYIGENALTSNSITINVGK